MNQQAIAIVVLAGAVLTVTGCAHAPRGPLPPQSRGTVHFIVTGAPETVAAFSDDKRIPENCTRKAVRGDKASDSKSKHPARVQVVFRCVNATPDTFTALGTIYVEVVNRRSRVKQASLDPVRISQDSGDPLSLVATTTDCIPDACYLGTEYWWIPQGACTDPCY